MYWKPHLAARERIDRARNMKRMVARLIAGKNTQNPRGPSFSTTDASIFVRTEAGNVTPIAESRAATQKRFPGIQDLLLQRFAFSDYALLSAH
jgi:hypothetical protein